MSKTITIAHLYPREMNIYGDMGNIITLVKRLEWRGYRAEVRRLEIGEAFDWEEVDLVFGGGGQDSGQLAVGADLVKHGGDLRGMAKDGVPMLVICGLYQLFGHKFVTSTGESIAGIGVFDASTEAGSVRMIGNVVARSNELGQLVGFENHSGVTKLAEGQAPLAKVVKGSGNMPKGGFEGAISGEAIGTYLHGPVLPKNPQLADKLLLAALKRRHGVGQLENIDNSFELGAGKIAATRPR